MTQINQSVSLVTSSGKLSICNTTITFVQSLDRTSVNITIDVMLIDDGGLFVAGLVDRGGCGIRGATGVFFWIFSGSQQQWVITSDLGG